MKIEVKQRAYALSLSLQGALITMRPLSDASFASSFRVTEDWRRRFFSAHKFDTVEDLLLDATAGGVSQHWVESVLNLRHQRKNRHSLQELQNALRTGIRPSWLVQLKPRLWTLYRVERSLCIRESHQEDAILHSLSIQQRKHLRGTGLSHRRRRSFTVRAAEHLDDLKCAVGGNTCVVWMDNFCRLRYSPIPDERRDRTINGTAFAVLPTRVFLGTVPEWPSLLDLRQRIDAVSRDIVNASVSLSNSIRGLLLDDLMFSDVRVPCDRRRHAVSAAPWFPYSIGNFAVGSTSGLVDALVQLVRMQFLTRDTMPFLVDVNVYYRILKLMYSVTHCSANVRGTLAKHPGCFGLWHAYVHCVRRTHALFLPVWAALEYPSLLTSRDEALGVRVYTLPRLFSLECMVVSMFLIPGRLANQLRQTAHDMRTRLPDGLATDMVWMLNLLINEYVPALMSIGIAIRDLYWEKRTPGTGGAAKRVLLHCLTVLNALEPRGGTEYVRALTLAALMWNDDVHGRLPGCCFVEECLEASLSRLARCMTSNQWTSAAEDVSDMFRGLGPAHRAPHDLNHAGMPQSLLYGVRRRFSVVFELSKSGGLLCVHRRSGEKFAVISRDWSIRGGVLPKRLLVASVSQTDAVAGVRSALLRLLQAKKECDESVVRRLCASAPVLSSEEASVRRRRMLAMIAELQGRPSRRTGVLL